MGRQREDVSVAVTSDGHVHILVGPELRVIRCMGAAEAQELADALAVSALRAHAIEMLGEMIETVVEESEGNGNGKPTRVN